MATQTKKMPKKQNKFIAAFFRRDVEGKYHMSDGFFGFLLTVPAILVLLTVIAAPILKGIYMSFMKYGLKEVSGKAAPVWNNFKNYTDLFRSGGINGNVVDYFLTTLQFVFWAVLVQFVIGLALALLLNTKLKGRGVFRGLFLVPWTIPSVVVALLWRLMLNNSYGIINWILNKLGFIPTAAFDWLNSPNLALPAVVIAAVWRQLPYMMVMLLAGLQSVDKSQLEAARIDGATFMQTLRHVTLPTIRPVVLSSVWIAIMNNFQMYTIINLMTGGGPSEATYTLSIAAYEKAFTDYNFGQGAAIGVMWLVFLTVVTVIINKISAKSAENL